MYLPDKVPHYLQVSVEQIKHGHESESVVPKESIREQKYSRSIIDAIRITKGYMSLKNDFDI